MTDKTVSDHAIRDFKIAMMNFDTRLFVITTYYTLLEYKKEYQQQQPSGTDNCAALQFYRQHSNARHNKR